MQRIPVTGNKNKSVLLIDADSKIPNIPLMKLSTYYKSRGFSVELIKVGLPYYPYIRKKAYIVPINAKYNKIFCSVIFEGNQKYIIGDNILFGGTGTDDLTVELNPKVEICEPDYSIYPEYTASYGFISRGCIRKCWFCKVPKKEGYIRQVANVDDIVRHKDVYFLDNNFLALPNHKDILTELIDKNIRCQFNQGLDIRLVDKENAKLLGQLRYIGEYIFAFDSWSYLNKIEKKLALFKWRKPWQFKFFVFMHPNMKLEDIVKRIEWLKANKCLPYAMRHINCWESDYSGFYGTLTYYCNHPGRIKKCSFSEWAHKSIKNINRTVKEVKLYENAKKGLI